MKKDILYPLRVLYGTVKHKVLRIPVPKKAATLSIADLFLISSKDGELLRYDMIVRLHRLAPLRHTLQTTRISFP